MWPIQIIHNQNACVYKMTNCINMTKYNINFLVVKKVPSDDLYFGLYLTFIDYLTGNAIF